MIPLLLLLIGVLAQATRELPPGWQESSPSSGDFRIVMPRNPTEAVVAAGLVSGQITRTLSANDADLSGYSVSWTEYGQSPLRGRTTDEVFAAVRKALEATHQVVVSTAPVTVAGHAGEEIVLATPDRQLTLIRLTVIGTRFYQLTAAVRADSDLAKARAFADSFAIKSAPAPY